MIKYQPHGVQITYYMSKQLKQAKKRCLSYQTVLASPAYQFQHLSVS